MKVERPRARLSEAPTRLNSRSTRPSLRPRRGHVGAGLGEQDDQGVLAQEGRFAAHVRAGDQPQPRVFGQGAIIGDEARAARLQRLLDHRMAARLDLEAGLLVEARPAPAALGGALGQRGGDVEPGERVGGGGDRLGLARAPPRPAPRNARPRRRARGRRPGSTRSASSCRSGALKRTTPARVWRWVKPESAAISRSALLRRHLDMEAEHIVVADLERRDAGLARGSAPRAPAIARRPSPPVARSASSASS